MACVWILNAVLTLLSTTSLAATSPCLELSGISEANGNAVTVNIAEDVAAGTIFQGQSSEDQWNIKLHDLPAHCRVAAQFNTTASTTVNFELWLPVDSAWNRRFLGVGNYGWSGAVNYPDVARGLKMNFATMSTNTGHNSSSMSGTFLQNPEQSIDFGHRAVHLASVHAKSLTEAYYGSSAAWSYWMGCSTGGRQAFASAQLYPKDFDGILAGCPAFWQTHLEAWENYLAKGQYPMTLDSYISSEMWTVIHDEAVRQCDHIDGITDSVIADPSRCNFAPELLLCRGSTSANNGTCLNSAQLANLKRIYGGWTDVNNTLVYPGVPVGSELQGLTAYTNADTPGGYGLDFYRFAILNTIGWTSTDITYADVELADKIDSYGALTNAFDPDLSAFEAHGGKLLHYYGWQDSIINTPVSELYYSSVMSFFSDSEVTVSDFYRLFLIPGATHCRGGDGAWVLGTADQIGVSPPVNDTLHWPLLALVEWREAGIAPEMLIGTRYANETVVDDQLLDLTIEYTRTTCPWPQTPVYVGGNVNNATSWVCPK